MDKSSSLGMPMSPQEISKKYKRQSLGMPKASPLHQQKAPGHFSMRYIFIASCNMCYSWSVFIFVVCFIFNKIGPLHIYFGVRHAPLFCILFGRETRSTVLCLALVFIHICSELVSFLGLISSLISVDYYLWELFQISRFVLDTSEKFIVMQMEAVISFDVSIGSTWRML